MEGSEGSAKFIVCNADSIPVAEYDSREHAIEACHDFAVRAAYDGDATNLYYIHNDSDFQGFAARDFPSAADCEKTIVGTADHYTAHAATSDLSASVDCDACRSFLGLDSKGN